jgi:ubiquinone biosynthesis protein UbiJ
VTPVTDILEKFGNRVIRLDPDAAARLGELHGKVIRLEFLELSKVLHILPSAEGVRLAGEHHAPADITLRGRIPAFLRLARGNDSGPLFSGAVEMRGNVELGQRLQRLLREFHVDWEEWLAGFIGDVLAHRVGHAARGARAWQSQAARTLGLDVCEYLQEESRLLPTRLEVEAFLTSVDALRASTDRLEQRVARLRAREGAA